jgi:tetratricopeptide (TPR) repeat protein
MTGTDWLTAIGILLSGAVIGFMFLYTTTKKKGGQAADASSTNPATSLAVRDLEARRDVLVAQLRELADVGGSDEERALLERQAANVLRQLDGLAPASPVPQPAASAARPAAGDKPAPVAAQPQPAGALKGFLWGIASAAAIAGLVFFVINQAKARDAGGSVTGGTNMGAAPMQAPKQQAQQPDAELQKLEAAAQASPDDLNVRNDLAHAYLERENMPAAFEQAQAVLAKVPTDPRANTVQGIVRIAMGESGQAIPQLEAATKADPRLTDGWVALAWAFTQSGRDDDASKAIDAGVKENPSQEARMREVLVKMREQAKQQVASPRHPVDDGSAPAATPAAAPLATGGGDSQGVKITLTIAPGAKVPDSKVIYVIAREAGQTSGPPTAVKRVMATGFPMTVELTAADSMMGQPLPAKMHLEVRLDTDGNAMTKEPTDLTAAKDGVSSGDAVALVLGKQ